jgi:hypothetical protein
MLSERSMKNSLDSTPASAQFVLDVIRDSHRHQCAFDPEADPSADLSFGTSVAEWRDSCDLLRTDKLGAALNEIWDIEISAAAWREVLEPPKQRTLRDVCDLVAAHATRTVVQPAGSFGVSCEAAGAFLAVRELLLRAGVQDGAILPSQPIAEIARRHPDVFFGPISRLAPGRLPTVTIRSPLHDAAIWTAGLGLVVALASAKFYPFLALAALAAVLLAVVATWIISKYPPRAVQFGGIITFRDLAETIADEHGPAPA